MEPFGGWISERIAPNQTKKNQKYTVIQVKGVALHNTYNATKLANARLQSGLPRTAGPQKFHSVKTSAAIKTMKPTIPCK